MRGKIFEKQYEQKCQQVRDFLSESGEEHLKEFSQAWL